MFFYLADLFESPFVIIFFIDGFYHSGNPSPARPNIMIYSISIEITTVSNNYSNGAIYVIKIFCLKFLKIYLNIILEMLILDIQDHILIKLIYNILVDQVMVDYLNIQSLGKESFSIDNFRVVQLKKNI